MLIGPELIIHHYVFHLRIFLISSHAIHFLGLNVFSHLNKLFLVNIVRSIKTSFGFLSERIRYLRESIQCFMDIFVDESVVYLKGCSNMCIVRLNETSVQSYCV